MKLYLCIVFTGIICAYTAVFSWQDNIYRQSPYTLSPVPPYKLLAATTGYLRQLTAELLFIQSSIYLGDENKQEINHHEATILAHNYLVTASLYPEFQDPYFYANAYIPSLSSDLSKKTNQILDIGREVYPKNLLFPFFKALNLFQYQNNPMEAARVMTEASTIPDAPPIFEHLAAILTAQGGQLEAGIIMLRSMVKGAEEKEVRDRYQLELTLFESALEIQKAVYLYFDDFGHYPKQLDDLTTKFIQEIPSFLPYFNLTYEPPNVMLIRPQFDTSKTK